MPEKPVIATTTWAHSGYLAALHGVGAQPLVVDEGTLLSVFDKCQGLLIPGGRDVCPAFYGERLGQRTMPGDEARDSLELALIERAIRNDMPFLGVCRGHQLLNVAMGGTLEQHINQHNGVSHDVVFNTKSRHFRYISNRARMKVNSLHHQAVGVVGNDLLVSAKAFDGTIEAIEGKKQKFVVGVQWHPELQNTETFNREMKELWYRFVHSTRKEEDENESQAI